MAITRKNDTSLVETKLNSDIKVEPLEEGKIPQKSKKIKKPTFLSTTIDELKLVEWPSLKYISRWASVIILFTIVLSLFMGAIDHIFTTGIKFVDCTSPQSGNRTLVECSGELLTNITGRG